MPDSMRWGVRPEVSNQAGTLALCGEGTRLVAMGGSALVLARGAQLAA